MHPEARNGFATMLADVEAEVGITVEYDVLDIGGSDTNGTVHDLMPPNTHFTILDLVDRPDVHILADARVWEPDRKYGMVIMTEVLEHVENWPAIIATAHKALDEDGILIITCASDGRPRHGALGDPEPAEGEWYENVSPPDLQKVLEATGFRRYELIYQADPGDLYAWAIKGYEWLDA